MVVLLEAHVVILQPVEAVHHVGATCVRSGVLALVSYVVVDVRFPVFLYQLNQVGLVLFQLCVPLFTKPLQLTIWLDTVVVKVFVETVVFR